MQFIPMPASSTPPSKANVLCIIERKEGKHPLTPLHSLLNEKNNILERILTTLSNMGLVLLKKISLLFLLLSASFLSTSLAGQRSKLKLATKSIKEAGVAHKQEILSRKPLHHYRKAESIHERLLRANTKDYGNYDPSPALGKPPFKLIPN